MTFEQTMNESFTYLLKTWRKSKSFTQRNLAEAAGTTPRIISFIESGREKPTKQMAERLSKALSLNKQAHIDFIKSAGFNLITHEVSDSAYYQSVLEAAEELIANHEPYPAMIVDAQYNVIAVNEGIKQSFTGLLDKEFEASVLPMSLIDILFHPDSVGEHFQNRDEAARFVIQRLHRECIASGKSLDVESFKKLYPYFSDGLVGYDESYQPTPQLIIHSKQNGAAMINKTIITTVGLPHDLGGDAIRVMFTFPVNENAKKLFIDWNYEQFNSA